MKAKKSSPTPTRVGKDIFGGSAKAEKPVTHPKKHHEAESHSSPKHTAQEEKTSPNARGRPKEHTESWEKCTVILLDRQIHFLDMLATNIRFNTKSAISRAEIIRAAIGAIEESGIDISRLKSEEEIKEHILNILNKNK